MVSAQLRHHAIAIAFAMLATFFMTMQVRAVWTEDDYRMVVKSQERQMEAFRAQGKTWDYLGEFNGEAVQFFPEKVLASATSMGVHFLGYGEPRTGARYKYFHSMVTPGSQFGRELRLPQGHTLVVVSKYNEGTRDVEPVNARIIKDNEGFNWGEHVQPFRETLGIWTDIHGNPL